MIQTKPTKTPQPYVRKQTKGILFKNNRLAIQFSNLVEQTEGKSQKRKMQNSTSELYKTIFANNGDRIILTVNPNQIHNTKMARQARIVLSNTAHHITQRGNRGDFIFFEKGDYQTYLGLLNEQCENLGISLYSYCLLPNQVHFIAEPREAKNLSRAIGETHRRYTNIINKRQGWTGHLFQNRFFSYACDEQYLLRAARYIETLPVTLKLTARPQNYLWSSAKGRIRINQKNNFIKPFNSFHTVDNWEEYLVRPMNESEMNMIQLHLQTGRPRGSNIFLDTIERQIGRSVRPKKRGRKPKNKEQAA